MKKSLVLFLFIFGLNSKKAEAQIGVSYFPIQSIVALNSDSEKMLWADLRMETNTFIANINFELNGFYNFKRKDNINYYIGLGINVNPFYSLEGLSATNGYLIPVGCRIKPFPRIRNVQLAFEISPYLNPDFEGGQIRSLLGLAYNF